MTEPEPPAYHPLPDKPWPDANHWILVWWNDEYGQWCAGTARTEYAEAVEKLKQLRARDKYPWRMVKETCTYTATDD